MIHDAMTDVNSGAILEPDGDHDAPDANPHLRFPGAIALAERRNLLSTGRQAEPWDDFPVAVRDGFGSSFRDVHEAATDIIYGYE